MAEPEVIDAPAAEEVPEPDAPAERPEPTAVEIVHHTRPAPTPTRQALMPLSAADVVAGMKAYQELLPQLLDSSDYQSAGGNRKFVKKSGWRKIARAFNLSVTVESLRVERDEDGNPLRAECVARASAPNGQVQDGDGYCSADESRFNDSSGRQKLENDLRATATTRAKNRAIADLVGMGEVSAEEINKGGDEPPVELASPSELAAAKKALGRLCDRDSERAATIWAEAGCTKERCPRSVATLLMRLDPEPAAETTDPAPDADDLPRAA